MSTAQRLAVWLGVFSVIGLVLQPLAFQDIYHAESDLRLEWIVVRITYVLSVAFHVVALRALLRP